MLLRKARMDDVHHIRSLITSCTGLKHGMVLPRSLSHIYQHLRDFYVATPKEGDKAGEVVGCCALSICWEDLAEIRSLVVREDCRGLGLGSQLVEACLSESLTLGIFKVFVLTDQVEFFTGQGFGEAPKDTLPQKIWADCLDCHKFPDCDETAMTMEL